MTIARAMVTEPDVLLADEPTGDRDRERSVEIMQLLTALDRDSGVAVLMSPSSRRGPPSPARCCA